MYKRCTEDATWEGFNVTMRHYGFTNFETCYTDEALKELDKIKLSQVNQILFIMKYLNYIYSK